jgi:hypothetical protein
MLVVLKVMFNGATPLPGLTVSHAGKVAGFTEKNGVGTDGRPEVTDTVCVAGMPEPFM